jgi:hypothetical protein
MPKVLAESGGAELMWKQVMSTGLQWLHSSGSEDKQREVTVQQPSPGLAF